MAILKKSILIFLISISFIFMYPFITSHISAFEEKDIYLSATEYDYPPFSVTSSGEADGFSVDLLKAVASEMGIQVSFKIDEWVILKEELRTGLLDILPLVGFSEDRDLIYDFTVPYIVMRGNIFVRSDEPNIIQEEGDLFGKEILVLNGDNSQEWAWSIGLDSELTATSTYLEAFQLLSTGQYDAVLAQGLVGEMLLSENGIDNIEAVYVFSDDGITRNKLNLEGYEQKFCFAVEEGNAALLSILNEGLSIVSVNGTYEDLYQKWFPFLLEPSPPTFADIMKYVGFALIPIILIFLGGYALTVRRVVKQKTFQIEKNNMKNTVIAKAFQEEFQNKDERFEYVIKELVHFSDSLFGFLFTILDNNQIFIRACYSKIDYKHCGEDDLKKVINRLIKKQCEIETKSFSINNLKNTPEEKLFKPLHQDVNRIMLICMERKTEKNIVALFDKVDNYSKNDLDQSAILFSGLWSMLDRAEQQNQIEYISFHDVLTNLYNRRFFEEEMRKLDTQESLPISIIMGDVNGLKLINDAFGHRNGDKLLQTTAEIMNNTCRATDIITRWGGDEFAVLMPRTTQTEAEKIIMNMQKMAEESNFPFGKVSIAFGLDVKTNMNQRIYETFARAEENMFQNKLNQTESVHNETIRTILNTLFVKSPEVKEHSERVSSIAVSIAEEMKLPTVKVNEIRTIGLLHDIGKIIIDLSILDSPRRLTDEEMKIIQQHPLSGSRMLSAVNEYTKLIPGVLHHHERYDGTGYPHRLKGNAIPLEARIIGVADAYDAMTATRPYRKTPLTQEQAIAELIKYKNIQFDGKIVDVYVNQILNHK